MVQESNNIVSGEFRPARKVERLSDCLEDRPGEIAMAVKMRPSHAWTRRPRGALLQLDPDLNLKLCRVGGSFGKSETPLFFEFRSNHNPYKNREWNKVWWAV
ncbi:hypothetical protein HY387_01645 [Candidatus Daviesbacteria bacterium]|nr:hypothetical protein [Candidatus Daviesbacteria bacterium]